MPATHTKVAPTAGEPKVAPEPRGTEFEDQAVKQLGTLLRRANTSAQLDACELFDTVDKDRSGHIDKAEFVKLHGVIVGEARNVMAKELALEQDAAHQKRIATIAKKLGLVLLVALLFSLAGNSAMTAAIVFLSKDTEVGDSATLKSKAGEVVKVGAATSYSTLFDLPAFDTETLSQMEKLTLSLKSASGSSEFEATVHIVSAIKSKRGSACTLLGSAGSRVIIDGKANSAFAIIDGVKYLVRDRESSPDRARRLGERGSPRLLSADEFFSAANGFEHALDSEGHAVGRRLMSDSAIQGYAEFGIAAAAGLLDWANDEGGAAYTSVYMRGTAYPPDAGTAGASMHVYYSSVGNVTESSVSVDQPGGNRVLVNSSLSGAMYLFAPDGELAKCDFLDEEQANTTDAQTFVVTQGVDGGLTLVVEGEEDGDGVFVVEYYELDPAELPVIFDVPTGEECTATLPPPPEEEEGEDVVDDISIDGLIQAAINATNTSTDGRRLSELMAHGASLWGAPLGDLDEEMREFSDISDEEMRENGRQLWGRATSATAEELYYIAGKVVYYQNTGAMNWHARKKNYKYWRRCLHDGGQAAFLYKCGGGRGCNMVLAFKGTDSISNMVNNIQSFPGGPDGKYHSGFYDYQDGLAGCVNHYRAELSRRNIKLDYIVGHSLGGAAATIYAQEHGNAEKGVVTYGAPKTNYAWADTAVKGWRFGQANDPIWSDYCFIGCPLIAHRHVVSSAFEMYKKWECRIQKRSRWARKKAKRCSSWWWCWFSWFWTVVTQLISSCGNYKYVKQIPASFSFPFTNPLFAGAGAYKEHSWPAYSGYRRIAF